MAAQRRAPSALLGVLKGIGLLLALPWLLLRWACRSAGARRRLRRQLVEDGLPPDVARQLAGRYRLQWTKIISQWH